MFRGHIMSFYLVFAIIFVSCGGGKSPEKKCEDVKTSKRFIIDNDGSNLFWRKSLSDEDLQWVVSQCPESVTTYMLCPNGIGKFYYPCKVGEPADRGKASALRAAFDRGEDPFGKLLGYLKKSGKEVFITYRINDVHNANDYEDKNTALFKNEHRDLIVSPEAYKKKSRDWMDYCLDLSHPEVREYLLSSIKDIAEMYDIDGIQLDWMRFPRHLSGDTTEEIWGKRQFLTEFTDSVRKALDETGKKRGKKILLSARVPTTPLGCKKLGLDIGEWTKLGLVDFITPAPFLSTDYSIPFCEFRKLMGEKPVPIYAGADFNQNGRAHNPESLRGWALSMYDQGADGLNIFNFPCWTECLANQPYDWIKNFNDPSKIRNLPALYPLVSNIHRVSADKPTALPARIKGSEDSVMVLSLPAAALPAERALLLVASDKDIEVTFEGKKLYSPKHLVSSTNIFLTYMDKNGLEMEPPAENCRIFIVPAEFLKKGKNNFIVTNKDKDYCEIVRFEMGLWY